MDPLPDLTILYGSQTGNAEDMAKRIGLQAKMRGFPRIQVMAIDDFPLKLLPKQKFVLFVCATTGHGQEPENMKNFYNFIRRRDLPTNCLKGLKFTVYGLGSSSYAKFNYVSKILFRRMKEFGVEPVQELVASDEQHQYGCDGLIYPKLDELWKRLESEISFDSGKRVDNNYEKPRNNSYSVIFQENEQQPVPNDKFSNEFKTKFNIRGANCIMNRRLTPETHFQDTRLFCYQVEDKIDFEPGDVCTIYPQNSDENVQEFIRLLKIDPRKRFKVKKLDPNYMLNYLYDFIPDGLEVQDLVKYYLDIQSVPKRSFFEYLWPFSGTNQLERNKLKEFASTEGQAELYEYCIRPKRTILETMLDFPETVKNINFEYIFDLIPPIKPRSFSIASSATMYPNEIHLLVGIVSYKTMMKKPRLGLCSNYLARMTTVDQSIDSANKPENSKLRFFIRKTSFKLPGDDKVAVIMIGPGLGLSPFRSFVQHRAIRKTSPTTTTNSYLYFGCRYKDRDFYFQNELEDYAKDLIIKLSVAFSRHEPKQYVQDLLDKDSELICKLILEQNAIIYVAGNSKLPEELRTLLGKMLLKQTGDYSAQLQDAENIVKNLEATNRIQYDCW